MQEIQVNEAYQALWQPRKGLEGPFNFNGRILYYDVKEGKYYDPTTDFYVSHSEYFEIVGLLVR